MTTEEFIRVLKIQTSDSAVSGTISLLERPPGRKPAEYLIKLSNWYAGLAEADRSFVRDVIRESAESAVFGFLCALDGVRAMEDGPEKGEFKLTYSKGGFDLLLNDPAAEYLHDIYNGLRQRS
jgi:hypothetical protein